MNPLRAHKQTFESAADHLFTSPPRPQPLAFEALSLKTPAKTVPPTPGTALQQKLETKLEKSLGSRLDIQLDQKMGAFQANILDAMKSLREDFQKSLSKTSSQVEVDQTSASASKPGPSNTRLDPLRSLIMAQPYLLISTLIVSSMTPQVTMLVLSRNPRGCPRPNQRNLLILSNSMLWPRALPRTTTPIIPMNLGLHLAEPRNILINLNTNLGPDIYLLPQRRISPLMSDIGLQNLLGRPTLIKTILNMTQTVLTTGK